MGAVAAEAKSEGWEDISEDYEWDHFLMSHGLGSHISLYILNDCNDIRPGTEGPTILGMEVHESGTGWGKNPNSMGFSELSEMAERVRLEAARYGITGREVQLYTLLYASI